jgi:hypothetical protein
MSEASSLRQRVLVELRSIPDRVVAVERLLEQPAAASRPRPPERAQGPARLPGAAATSAPSSIGWASSIEWKQLAREHSRGETDGAR